MGIAHTLAAIFERKPKLNNPFLRSKKHHHHSSIASLSKIAYNSCLRSLFQKIMNQTYALLKTHTMKKSTTFTKTVLNFDIAHLDDPAITVMTDFQKRPPYTTSITTPATEALQQMKLLGVKSLFAVNADNEVAGHISARDIQGTNTALIAKENDLKMSEVTVKMVMTSPEHLHTLQLNELSNARVGHIVRLLTELSVNYIFVIESEGDMDVLRGLFSISRISMQLGENVMSDLSSHSVADMNKIFHR